jgi:RNA polymerase sigma factor (sigma-70 family)
MARVATRSVVRQIGTLFEGGSATGLSDRQLLERYAAVGRDAVGEAAFAALVGRHGPMVLGVCRQLLGDVQHAEDAFQAVFLVLARKARSIRDPDLLGNWLYGVAIRTARCARRQISRRRRFEEGDAMKGLETCPCAPSDWPAIAREQAEAIHDEVDRLPSAFRRPVVLCYFEGLSLDEAARRLRCPAGTLHSRLARAREKLRIRLARRGVVLPAAVTMAVLSPRSASASISPLLCDSTTRSAIAFAARHAVGGAISASAATLAREVLRTMILHKLRLTAMSLLFLAVAAIGTGWVTRPLVLGDEPRGAPASAQAPIAVNQDEPVPRPAPGRMIVVGRVLDPQGHPVPNASVMVYGAPKYGGERPGGDAPAPIGEAVCDGSGRFRLDAPRISSSTHHMVGAAALAPGYGTGWVGLDTDVDQPATDIPLRPEKVIVGRLFDVTGQPAPGVRVSVEGMGHASRNPQAPLVQIEGPHFWGRGYAKCPEAWPRPVISDSGGRFTIHGVGRAIRVVLIAEDPRFARQRLVIDTDDTAETQQVTGAMEPARIIFGRVTYADTRKPVPHAAIEIVAFRGGPGYESEFAADAEGNFRTNPFSADRYNVAGYAPEGQPYLNATTGFIEWTKGTIEHRVDLVLRRGPVIRGKVIEEGSGRPVVGAGLRFTGRRGAAPDSGSWNGTTHSGPDGSYLLPVLPGPGTLKVLGPSEDYVLQENGERVIREGQPGGRREYAHAFITCDMKPDMETLETNVVLRRGMTVKARVLGPDGRPVQEAWVFSRVLLRPAPWPWRYYSGEFHGDVHDGRFELHGLAPDAEVPVFFFDPEHKLGATAQFSVKAATGGPITVRLEPCGQAIARLVDPKGKPITGYREQKLISMLVTPGRDWLDTTADVQDQPSADEDYLSRIDPAHHADVVSNVQGRVTFPALIPGATYRVFDMTTLNDPGGRKTRRLFVAGAGEAVELGDVVIEKPAP